MCKGPVGLGANLTLTFLSMWFKNLRGKINIYSVRKAYKME